MSAEVVYLVIRADRTYRVARKPRIAPDEVALKINLRYPASWGKVFGEVNIDMPDPTPELGAVVVEGGA